MFQCMLIITEDKNLKILKKSVWKWKNQWFCSVINGRRKKHKDLAKIIKFKKNGVWRRKWTDGSQLFPTSSVTFHWGQSPPPPSSSLNQMVAIGSKSPFGPFNLPYYGFADKVVCLWLSRATHTQTHTG